MPFLALLNNERGLIVMTPKSSSKMVCWAVPTLDVRFPSGVVQRR
jgi:hypothetical protein